jgi:hypothetical protein
VSAFHGGVVLEPSPDIAARDRPSGCLGRLPSAHRTSINLNSLAAYARPALTPTLRPAICLTASFGLTPCGSLEARLPGKINHFLP